MLFNSFEICSRLAVDFVFSIISFGFGVGKKLVKALTQFCCFESKIDLGFFSIFGFPVNDN
jgi:hypothetical protein